MPSTKQQEIHEQRQSRLANGLCVKCGDNPVGKCLDMTKSVFCDDCRPHSRRNLAKCDVPRVYDIEEQMMVSERKYYAEILAHSQLVKRVITHADKDPDNKKGITLSEIHRRVGQGTLEMTFAALEQMEVQKARMVPERYSLRVPQATPVLQELWGTVATPSKPYAFDGNALPDFDAVMQPRRATA